jgi:hypothetical protein
MVVGFSRMTPAMLDLETNKERICHAVPTVVVPLALKCLVIANADRKTKPPRRTFCPK